jgi:hypothetical protein
MSSRIQRLSLDGSIDGLIAIALSLGEIPGAEDDPDLRTAINRIQEGCEAAMDYRKQLQPGDRP